jgi:hypothetical protein
MDLESICDQDKVILVANKEDLMIGDFTLQSLLLIFLSHY